jgi:hypothetical protein
MKPLLPFLCALGLVAVAGANDAVTPAQVFTQVSRDLAGYKSLETIYELGSDPQPFQVKAWFDGATFRRVKASQKGDGGLLTRDFFYDNDGILRFASVTLANEAVGVGKPATVVEERFDFTGDVLVRYLGADKVPVAKDQASFKEMEKALLAMSNDLVQRIEGSTAYVGMIGGVDDPAAKKGLAGTVFGAGYTDGIFSGTEQGDYLHLDVKQADGEVATFFVITKDPSLDAILTEPAKSKGAKIRVYWTEKMQLIPEAGEVTRLKTCDRIELLK